MMSAFVQFTGMDTRRLPGLSDTRSARDAQNLYLTSGRVWSSRPGCSLFAVAPEESRGLYEAGGVLRTIVPAGYADLFNAQSPGLFFDFVGDGSAYARDDVQEFINAEVMGASGQVLPFGSPAYAVIRRRSTGALEHHWFVDRPDTPTGTVNTKVVVPFDPGGPVAKLSGKMWTLAQAEGIVPFSSTEFGPSDWTTPEDAGFLPALTNAPGARSMVGLGTLQSVGAADDRHPGLVVFFADGIQVWATDPDPLNHFLTGILDGVGTDSYRSIANAFGDPLFFDRGGFMSLRISQRAGALDSAKIGAPIEELTRGIDPATIAASVWWDRLGIYLCAVGSDIYCWKFDPLAKVDGWSRWTLPWKVTDLVVKDGDLYARTEDHNIYRFHEDLDTDAGTPIAFSLLTQYLTMGQAGVMRRFDAMGLYQEGRSLVSCLPDPVDTALSFLVYEAQGQTRLHQKIPLLAMSDGVALRFQGQGRWRLSGFAVHYNRLGV